MLAQLLKRGGKFLISYTNVEREIRFAGREPYLHPINLPASGGTFVFYVAKSDDCAAPHFWIFFSCLFHHFSNHKTVFALLFIFNAIDEILDTCGVLFCLYFGHTKLF